MKGFCGHCKEQEGKMEVDHSSLSIFCRCTQHIVEVASSKGSRQSIFLANIEKVIGSRQHDDNDPDILNFLSSLDFLHKRDTLSFSSRDFWQ